VRYADAEANLVAKRVLSRQRFNGRNGVLRVFESLGLPKATSRSLRCRQRHCRPMTNHHALSL
jgi:hypothetical protein